MLNKEICTTINQHINIYDSTNTYIITNIKELRDTESNTNNL